MLSGDRWAGRLWGQSTQQFIHALQATILLIAVQQRGGLSGSVFNIKPQDTTELIQLRFKVIEQLNSISIFEETSKLATAGRFGKLTVHFRLDGVDLTGNGLYPMQESIFYLRLAVP